MKEAFDSARAALRGGADRGDDRLARELRRDAGAADDAGPRGVRGGAAARASPFLPRRGPKRFLGEGRLAARRAARRCASVFDANGRFDPRYDDDDVAHARGRRLRARDRPARRPVVPEARGRRRADARRARSGSTRATLATSAPGVFAGGDVAFGPRNLIEAVANGKLAARSIHEHLAREGAPARGHARRREDPDAATTGCSPASRCSTARRRRRSTSAGAPASPRSRPATTPDAARRQAARCLVCHVQTIYDPEKCVLCSRCVDVCPEYCLAIVPFETLELPGGRAGGARGAGRGERPAALRDGQGRRPLHPLRPVRRPLPDRRDDDGALPDHGALRPRRAGSPAGTARRSHERRRQKDRREFLVKLGIGAGRRRHRRRRPRPRCARCCPNVSYDAPTTVKLGLPAEFPDGLKFLPEQRLFVFREGKVFHAVSAVCTHLGCTVRAEALPQPETMRGGRRAAARSPTASPARATARSTRATARSSPGPRRGRSPGTTSRVSDRRRPARRRPRERGRAATSGSTVA